MKKVNGFTAILIVLEALLIHAAQGKLGVLFGKTV